jgi:hypothetical protein
MKHEDTPWTWDDDPFDEVFVARISQNICSFDKSSEKRTVSELPRLNKSLMVLDSLCQST